MAATSLRKHLIDAGAKLLAALDDAGLQAQGAAWVFDHGLGDWRYVIVTSLVDTMGRSKVYRQLLTVIRKLDTPKDLTVADIHLVSPGAHLFKAIARIVNVDIPGGGFATFQNCAISDAKFDAVIFRWIVRVPTQAEAAKIEKQFKRRVKELTE